MTTKTPLYFNAKSFTVIQYRINDESLISPISAELAAVPLEHALPARTSSAYPGKRSYEGSYWSATMRSHISYESFDERLFATYADFLPEVTSFSAQPFVLKWPKGTKKHRGHVPDYFCRLDNREGVVIDVKPLHRVAASQEQFDLTRAVCEAVGWGYEVFSGLPLVFEKNLLFLAGFRQERYSPADAVALGIIDAFMPSTSLAAGIRRASRQLKLSEPVVRGNVLHLLWHGVLSCPMEQPLTDRAQVCPTNHFEGTL